MFNAAWIYVGILYALAVWLARRAGVDLPRRVAALFYLLVLLFLFRPMTGGWVSFSTDIIELVPPWSVGSNLTKFTVSNPQLPDVTMQMVPWAHQVREAWRSGELPLWNALAGCGMPLAGNGQSSGFSPFRILALPLPLGYAITAEGAMKLLVALTFTFLFCRRRGMSYAASIVAALSFGFSLFVVVWLHFTQATVAVFLPAVFYGIDLLAERVTPRRFAAAAILWAASLLGGHTETAAHIALFAALYVIWIASKRFLFAVAGAVVAAAILASPLLVSMGEAIVRSMRFHQLRLRPYGEVPFSDLPSLFLLLQPRLYGSLPKEAWASFAHAESISGFAGILGIASLIGIIVALATRRMTWRSHETFFALAWITSFLAVANVTPIARALYVLIPYTAHARFRLLLCWFAALLAGVLVDRIRDDRLRAPFLIGLAVTGWFLIFVFIYVGFPDAAKRTAALLTSIPALAVMLFAALLPVNRVFVPLLSLALVLEVFAAGRCWNPVMPVSSMYPETPLIKSLKSLDGNDRVVGIGGALFPNLNAIFGFEDVRVLDALALDRYMGVLSAATEYDTSEYYAKWKDPDSPLLDYLNVRWVVTEPGVKARRFRLRYDSRDGRIYENLNVLPRFFAVRNVVVEPRTERLAERLRTHTDWPNTAFVERSAGILPAGTPASGRPEAGGPAAWKAALHLERLGPADFRLRIRAPRPVLVVSSQALWPAWRIETDRGTLAPVRVNGAFLGFIAPPGHSLVRVRYAPIKVYTAVALSLTTFLALMLWAVLAPRRRRVKPARSDAPLG